MPDRVWEERRDADAHCCMGRTAGGGPQPSQSSIAHTACRASTGKQRRPQQATPHGTRAQQRVREDLHALPSSFFRLLCIATDCGWHHNVLRARAAPWRIPVTSATDKARVSKLMTACDAHSLPSSVHAVSPLQLHSSIRQLQKCKQRAVTCDRPCTSLRRTLQSSIQQQHSPAIASSEQVSNKKYNGAALMWDAPLLVENESA